MRTDLNGSRVAVLAPVPGGCSQVCISRRGGSLLRAGATAVRQARPSTLVLRGTSCSEPKANSQSGAAIASNLVQHEMAVP